MYTKFVNKANILIQKHKRPLRHIYLQYFHSKRKLIIKSSLYNWKNGGGEKGKAEEKIYILYYT